MINDLNAGPLMTWHFMQPFLWLEMSRRNNQPFCQIPLLDEPD